MSTFTIYYQNGAKMMRQVTNKEEYLSLRNSTKQQDLVGRIRKGDDQLKSQLVQMNYSCLPNPDGSLKGTTTMSDTVGMDIDHIPTEQMVTLKERILEKKEELGLLMLELSARAQGYHLVFRRKAELTQQENLQWASNLLGVAYDAGAKDITRVFFTTTASPSDLLFLSDDLFKVAAAVAAPAVAAPAATVVAAAAAATVTFPTSFKGIPYTTIIEDFWKLTGGTPTEGERNNRLHQLAFHLRAICDDSEEWLIQLMPRFGLSEQEVRTIIHSACKEPTKGSRLMNQIIANRLVTTTPSDDFFDDYEIVEDDGPQGEEQSTTSLAIQKGSGEEGFKKLPLGIRDSVNAVGPQFAMPIITAICPCIGALATGVRLDVHGAKRGLNIQSYVVGDFASGKGKIDPVVEAWMGELIANDKMYKMQEAEWREKKRAAKNKKEQPEEPKLPMRVITLNNTVANLAVRLANTEGKHAFSFTPEADNVTLKWRSSVSDFSVMVRQAYDGSRYEREAHSVDAVSVYIEELLWNITMCGTADALYRLIPRTTDGLQSRFALARTPDNTFAPLEDRPYVLTDLQKEHIQQVAHLLMVMQGDIVLSKLEQKGREWLERVRLETMKNDDTTKARQRFRICVTAQRMVCCLMLCKVCETLIKKHGLNGAEAQLKQNPSLWKDMLQRAQTPQMLAFFDVIADSLMENALYYFRDRLESEFNNPAYVSNAGNGRQRRTQNDTIFDRLDHDFTFAQAMEQSVAVKGSGVTQNSVQQMLKNWNHQHLIEKLEKGKYRKI